MFADKTIAPTATLQGVAPNHTRFYQFMLLLAVSLFMLEMVIIYTFWRMTFLGGYALFIFFVVGVISVTQLRRDSSLVWDSDEITGPTILADQWPATFSRLTIRWVDVRKIGKQHGLLWFIENADGKRILLSRNSSGWQEALFAAGHHCSHLFPLPNPSSN